MLVAQTHLRAHSPTRLNLPLPHMTLHTVIGTGISLGLKTFEQPQHSAPPRFGQKPITAQPRIKTAATRVPGWGPSRGPGCGLRL